MSKYNLVEVDTLDFLTIVNDEMDNISHSPNPAVKAGGSFMHIPLTDVQNPQAYGGAKKQMRMDNICCGAHGLSLMITVTRGNTKHTLLFDAGPEEEIFEKNASRLRADLGSVEHIHLSHYHRDHSGGLLKAIRMINSARPAGASPVTVDLHPNRPEFRGINAGGLPITLEADPTFDEVERAGGIVTKNADAHTALDDTFFISGEIPRITPYEQGIPGGIRLDKADGEWQPDPLIMEERFTMVNLKGKGLVLFTGCSHAGVINAIIHASEMLPNVPMYAVVGGYHLADAPDEKIQKTVSDFQDLSPKILMPGHCSGWRFKNAWDRVNPGGMVPVFAGQRYTL
ncbi:hypothetical protein BU26DRAFT_545785 [Trematosphaeria pertusa]|uniref:Uncharacterized protein n=1 Tax=Trematosphaeria pertusa TaxID=390896 RepID=A0A6A6J0U6_9PLEO|nr:uncharacterized protein BU26DRAFT_545785 [Trematosphaeria pertusa]KAF2256465.1 hypothetical protein BU26DRAFT_545785 [Trematosphaeria pertusa]